MFPKLTESVSLQELQQMREDGLTNRQIAEALDVGYSTICRYLGRNEGKRAPRGTYAPKKAAQPKEQEVKPPVLQKLLHIEEYAGKENRYTVNRDAGTVIIKSTTEEAPLYSKEGLEHLITELLDVLSLL